MPEGIDPIPINAFFASDGINPNPEFNARLALTSADLIFGVDVMSRHEFLVYGRDALDRIARTGVEEDLRVLAIELDQDEGSDELEQLIALVEVVKGKHDYRSYADV
jgi:hypothetical protein